VYTYNERKPVGVCERIAKDDKMRVSYTEHHLSRTAEPYTLEQYTSLWGMVEQKIGWETEVIEDEFDFRGASLSVKASDSNEQGSAIYGRILANAMGVSFDDGEHERAHTTPLGAFLANPLTIDPAENFCGYELEQRTRLCRFRPRNW